jgi:hypothetical protein
VLVRPTGTLQAPGLVSQAMYSMSRLEVLTENDVVSCERDAPGRLQTSGGWLAPLVPARRTYVRRRRKIPGMHNVRAHHRTDSRPRPAGVPGSPPTRTAASAGGNPPETAAAERHRNVLIRFVLTSVFPSSFTRFRTPWRGARRAGRLSPTTEVDVWLPRTSTLLLSCPSRAPD